MPGTTYTAEPDTMHDPIGRLADFARFGVNELGDLSVRLGDARGARRRALEAHDALVRLANHLEGYTTADND